MKFNLKKIIRSDFTKGSLLNLASVFVLSISGLLLYFIIAKAYDAYTLGLFSLVFSIYIIVAQIGIIGIQSSVLVHIPRYSEDKKNCSEIVSSAIMIVFILSTVLSLIILFGRNYLAGIFKNPDISVAIAYSIIGFWCFILNKLFLNIINGFNRMKAYAFFNAFRYIGMVFALLLVFFLKVPGKKLLVVFSISEGLLLITIFFYTLRLFSFVSIKRCFSWIKRHFRFGIRGAPGLMLSEMNTRIDILMLGYFCSTATVGIYSFVAIIVEGIIQFPSILRTNVSPVFTKLFFKEKKEEVRKIVRKGVKLLFPLMICVALAGIALYPFVVNQLLKKPEFAAGWIIFSVLIIGAVIYGAYAPFKDLMLQAGHPGKQTIYILSVVMTNILLNLILIPRYNMLGAALATSLSFILAVIYLKLFSRRFLKINI